MRVISDGRGISVVVAPIILVAVAVVAAVAIAHWMSGLTGQYTRFEKIELTSAYVLRDENGKGWKITLTVRNTGTIDTSLDGILLNGKQPKAYNADFTIECNGENMDLTNGDAVSLPSGKTVKIEISIKPREDGENAFTSGVSLEIRLHSTSGRDYIKPIKLP